MKKQSLGLVGKWRASTWGDEISLEYGKALSGYDATGGRYRVFGSNGAIGWTSEPLAQGPGVILGRKGAYRGVQFSREPFFVIDTAYYVVPKNEFDMRWLYYAIKHYKLGEIDDGSPIPSTTRAAVYMQDLDVPSLPEQRRIAHILGTLDDKIELNRRMNETLEAMARAVFKSWFVDVSMTSPPKGWQVSTIGEETEVVGGSTPSTEKPEYWEGGDFHWVTPKDLSNLQFPVLLDTVRCITEAGLKQVSSGLLPAGTVLLSSRAPIGYIAISEIPVAINQGFIAMKCDRSLPNYYVRWWTVFNMEIIEGNANGTTFQEISKGNFRPLPVLVPPKSILDDFRKIIEPLHRKMVSNLRETHTLAALRDALLPKLVGGEVRVKKFEKGIGTA